ncbi:MAG TPA: PorV/PorQ family protein [Bacteroidia bacterium]|nr:PorV/PorQ family protein [Bacteroidia bacterium]
MKRFRTSFFLVFLLGLSVQSFAQIRKYSNEFLAIGVGARSLAMSGASVASADDVTSGYWNPAGLLGVKPDFQVGLQHAEYFASIAKYDYLGFAGKIDSASSFGFSVLRFAVDDIPNTTQLIDPSGNINYDNITTFSAQDYAFLISYARKAPIAGLHYGANVKIIRRKVGDFAGAWGFGLDAGAQYDYKGWRLGAVVRDVTSTFNAWSFNLSQDMKDVFAATGNEIPQNSLELTMPRLIFGASKTYPVGRQQKFSVGGEMDFINTFDGKRNVLVRTGLWSMEPVLGLEAGFKNIIFLRTGIGNIQKSKDVFGKDVTTFQPNLGVGLRIKSLTIDYAFTDIGNQSVALYSNIFSLKIDINKKKIPGGS